MCDCPMFCVLSGLPLTSTRFQSRIFVERLCLCLTGFKLARRRWGLYAFDALLALLSIFSGRRFFTSQPYFRLGRRRSFTMSQVLFYGISCFGILLGWLLENRLPLKKLPSIIGIVLRHAKKRMRIIRSLIVNRVRWRSGGS